MTSIWDEVKELPAYLFKDRPGCGYPQIKTDEVLWRLRLEYDKLKNRADWVKRLGNFKAINFDQKDVVIAILESKYLELKAENNEKISHDQIHNDIITELNGITEDIQKLNVDVEKLEALTSYLQDPNRSSDPPLTIILGALSILGVETTFRDVKILG